MAGAATLQLRDTEWKRRVRDAHTACFLARLVTYYYEQRAWRGKKNKMPWVLLEGVLLPLLAWTWPRGQSQRVLAAVQDRQKTERSRDCGGLYAKRRCAFALWMIKNRDVLILRGGILSRSNCWARLPVLLFRDLFRPIALCKQQTDGWTPLIERLPCPSPRIRILLHCN